MRVSLKWLNELVPVRLGVAELVDRLDMTGTVVEAVQVIGQALEDVVVGQIIAKERHPEADKLWVTKVEVGGSEPLTIVCGAQNFEAGDKVPVALVGATLPNGMTIKRAKLRGVASEGMNCSPAELGLGTDHGGIMILPADAPVGTPFAEYHGLADTVLDLEITPNRPDCLSMAGIAREIGAVTGEIAAVPSSHPEEGGARTADRVTVHIDEPELCPRYTARLIRNVKIGRSPDWLAEKIIAAGARPISNVVDITNYVMFELGQPLHAFDADLLATDESGKLAIGVRRARAGETLVTLDRQKRGLTADTLLITDPSGPVALAGVMGGESTEVNEATVNILLESACFQPASISLTSRALGLVSEASMRFERGVDRSACDAAADRAAQLMADLAGGEIAPGIVDAYPLPFESHTITLRLERLWAVLGATPSAAEAERILTSLGCSVRLEGTTSLSVEAPSFRPDLEREIDLVEEVVRVWGIHRVPATLPRGRGRIGALTAEQRWRQRIGSTLRAVGLNETMTYAFADPCDLSRLGWRMAEDELQVELINPMSSEQSLLRRTLLPGLLRSVSYNQRRGSANVHLYELGRVFWTAPGRKQPKERQVLGAVLAGAWHDPAWNDAPTELDFFDGKGAIGAVLDELGIERWRVRVGEQTWLQPGRRADVLLGGEVVGWLGEVHPRVLAAFDAGGPVTALELDVRMLTRAAREVKPYREIPRFPAVSLDLAIVVSEDVSAERLEQALVSAGGKLLESVRLFDVYRGKGVAEGKKSVAFTLTYRVPDRTLTAEEVQPIHDRLVRKVLGVVGGELRA